MLELLLQIITAFLFSVGLLFILIEARARFDRSFLYFGITLLLLCALATSDTWVSPLSKSPSEALFWPRIQHVLACAIIPFFLWYLMLLTDRFSPKVIRLFIFGGLAFSVLSQTPLMLSLEGGKVATGVLYLTLFLPYCCWAVISWMVMLFKGLKTAPGSEKKILWFQIVGIFFLGLSGVLDALRAGTSGPISLSIPSFIILGVLVYGIMSALVFTERFLFLFVGNRELINRESKLR